MALFTGLTKGLQLAPRLLGNFCEAALERWQEMEGDHEKRDDPVDNP